MSLYAELTRLEARYAAAQLSRVSCPRNREILRAKIEDLQRELFSRFVTKTKTEISDTEVQRVQAALDHDPVDGDTEVLSCLEAWQDEQIRLWELES